jgi:hypothetical protein
MNAAALSILAGNRYAVIGTATPDGSPWVSPLYYVNLGLGTFLWLSRESSRHSQLIARNDRIAVTVFDSTVPMGGATAFYALATAGPCPAAELSPMLAAFSERSAGQGFPAWRLEQVTGDAELRLYRARVSRAWLLPVSDGPERRIPLTDLD